MKKVLIIGELNMTVSSVNQYLSTRFQTQICPLSYDITKGMEKVFKADLVVICLVGSEKMDERILSFFGERKQPMLILGTKEECETYRSYAEKYSCEFAVRPVTLQTILKKCMMLLKLAVEEEPAEGKKEEGRERKIILAVDDSGILLRSVKKMLEPNYDVVVATSGEKALSQAIKTRPDLILLDYEMPGWDGKKTLEEIRANEEIKEIPVLFLTAVADKAHITAVLGLNPSGYLLKPIEQVRLLETVDAVLAGEV